MVARKEVKKVMVRLSVNVDEVTWRKLRDAAERERDGPRGRASVNALIQRLIDAYLKGGK